MNRILARQLRRLGLDPDGPPSSDRAWQEFLSRVGAYYDDADRNRYVLERSIELASREMSEINDHIRSLARHEMQRTEHLARHNFNELPVPAWLENFQQAVGRLDDLRASGVEDLGAYLDSHPEGLTDLIERVEVLDCNPAVSELLGADRQDLLGHVDPSGLGPGSLDSWRRQFEAIWDGVGKVEVEFTGQRFDGTSFAAILHWSAGEFEGAFDFSRVMIVVIDISDRIAAEEKMRQLVVAKDNFLASVSHELRTPLTSVLGYAGVLLDGELGADERRAMLSTIVDQAADLSDIVEDLLVGARADVGQLSVDAVPVDVDALVAAAIRAFPGVELIAGASGGGVVALADAGRVRQILRNLLTNARRYGGDRVAVRAPVVRDGSVEISVLDDGPLLEAGVSGAVFERYFRTRGDAGPTGSVGIGLTISRDLAHLMGGELSYRHDGQWSEFVLSLQLAEEHLRATG